MKTLVIRTNAELEAYKKRGEIANISFREWKHEDLILRSAKIGGYLDLEVAKIGGCVNLCRAEIKHLYLYRASIEGYLDLEGAEIGGGVDLEGAEIGGCVKLCHAEIEGDLILRGAEIGGCVKLYGAEIGGNIIPISPYTKATQEFLRRLPAVIDMTAWQSSKEWLGCNTVEELYSCGTVFCVGGFAEAEYYVKHGELCKDLDSLYPELKHIYFMEQKQAEKEIEKILDLNLE